MGRPKKPGSGRKAREEKKELSTHAMLVKLGRAVKKAKQFEVRKIVRRLKQADADKKPGLEAQLEAAKGASLQELTAAVGAKLGLASSGEEEAAGAVPCWAEGPPKVVCVRILAAPCIKAAVASLAAGRQAPSKGLGEGEGPPTPPESSSEGEEERSEADEEAEAALAKLLKRSGQATLGAGSDDDDMAIDLEGSDVEDLLSLDSGSAGETGPDGEDDGACSPSKPSPSAKGVGKGAPAPAAGKPASAKPTAKQKKPKNRMGQRERQRLAAAQHGRPPPRRVDKAAAVPTKKALTPVLDTAALHPSWQARRSQRPAIVAIPSPASKIVFDD